MLLSTLELRMALLQKYRCSIDEVSLVSYFGQNLVNAVNSGQVPQSRVDVRVISPFDSSIAHKRPLGYGDSYCRSLVSPRPRQRLSGCQL